MKTTSIRTMKQVFSKLRRHAKTDYRLLILCNFIANLLVSAFSFLIWSSTVQETFPPGGDSMKQVMMVFCIAIFGCLVFTVYAAMLFFRCKSREIGVFMALGAGKRSLAGQLFRELFASMAFPALTGIILGPLFTLGIWQIFRLFLPDKEGTMLSFTPYSLIICAAFLAASLLLCFFFAVHFLSRTNILDVVNEQRKSEPIRDVRSWYLPAGIFLIVFGAVAGYGHPYFFEAVFGIFAPAWTNLLYLPIFPGIYLIILFLVIRGKGSRKHPYRKIISRSMLKFQGRQTVNNMLIMTLLVAGACFAMFYVPITASGNLLATNAWEKDFSMRLRADQDMPAFEEIEQLAGEYRLTVEHWAETPLSVLGKDGTGQDIDENGKYIYYYQEVIADCTVIPASGYEALTGEHIDIPRGTYDECVDRDSPYGPDTETTLLTNMATGEALDVSFGDVHYSHTLSGLTVLNDEDFARISEGLDSAWQETFVQFNVAAPYGDADEYRFSQALWERIVSASSGAGMDSSFYSRAVKTYCDERGETYWADNDPTTSVHFTQEDSDTFQFWSLWKYKPYFRVMEQNNLFMNMAILFLTFLFMAIVCYTAVLIISYTRSLTVALSNRQVYEDLTRLGAGNEFRFRSVREQLSKICSLPTILGMTAITLFFLMILFANDGRISLSEGTGVGVCVLIMMFFGAGIFLFYRRTLKVVCRMLGISTKSIPEKKP